MAYVFRIHEARQAGQTQPTAAANVHDWANTAHISGTLLNNINLGAAGDKMGTSIPSLFARLFLFEGVFQALVGKPLNDLTMRNVNTSLISDCFDLLEFLYQHGNDKHLVIRHWNANNQIAELSNDGDPRHAKLAQVLRDELNVNSNFHDIYLFYWKSANAQTVIPQEVLIGGTSPFTLVFTSPNWKRKMAEKGLSFRRLDGSSMFSDTEIRPLVHRDSKFKEMIYSMYMAFQPILATQSHSFEQYIYTSWNAEVHSPEILAMGGNPSAFHTKYPNIRDENGATVVAGNLPISYEKIAPSASGYEIRATTNRYATYLADGATINLNTPLVLNANGIPGATYVGKAVWNPATCIINEAATRGTALHNRILPGGMGIKYPYLIWSDFLEDKILKVSYKLDQKKFVTAYDGDSQFILPLKKEFFNFFNINDINSIVSTIGGVQKKLVEVKSEQDKVEVTLNIPIAHASSTIELKKEYRREDIVASTDFMLAFFPFYKVIDKPTLNMYSVMSCGDINLSFYNQTSVSSLINCSSLIRTAQGTVLKQTKYHKINNSFDFVEVRCGNVNGLVIPKMQEIDTQIAASNYSFAVDFGTSNTYIAYKTNHMPIPNTFDITNEDAQTVFLNSPDYVRTGDHQIMGPYYDREFVPTQINRNASVSYPARTATCETPNFESNQANLFGNISIGYNMQNEDLAIGVVPYVYKTDLKWALEKNPSDVHYLDRVKSYCMEILWLLKNKSLLNGGSDVFEVFLTFPETMKVPTRNLFINQCWQWAKTQLQLNCTFRYGADISESIAPYNMLAPQIGGQSLLNIDIGGGTSDLLFVSKDNVGSIMGAYYSSTLFAADDLWGDGLNVGVPTDIKNVFYTYIKTQIEQNQASYPPKVLSSLKALVSLTNSSADAMGFLFKHDSIFSTSTLITSEPKLYSIIFIHYAALMYHVARLIKKLGVAIPEHFSFTGMGSRYINLISNDTNDIKLLSKMLLEKYTGLNAPATFNVYMAQEAKEVTAKGALLGDSLLGNFKIPANSLEEVVDYGFDTNSNLVYEDVAQVETRNAVLQEYNKFIDSLNDRDFANFLFSRFGLSIPEHLCSDLRTLAASSYTDVCAGISQQHFKLDVKETLFFWPLKIALSKL